MPIPSDYQEIIGALVQATRIGRVPWRTGPAAEFVVPVSGSKVAIWAGTDEETDRAFVSFALQDAAGQLLDTWFVDLGDEHYGLMYELYQGAKRQGRGIPQKLESIREALRSGKAFGEGEG